MRAHANVATPGSKAEQQADDVGRRSLRTPPARNDELTAPAGPGAHALTSRGREHFESVVGAPLGDARIRVDGEAAQVSQLARAEAVTYGRNVFVPPPAFSPETDRGRALIAHELTHVAQAPALPRTVLRKGTPHYPTDDERKKIEKIMGRHTSPPVKHPAKQDEPDKPATPETDEIVDTGTKLTADQIDKLAGDLLKPYRDTLEGGKFKIHGDPATTVSSFAEAMEFSTKALAAVKDKFGAYLDPPITLTKDPSVTLEQRKANHQVLVALSFNDSDIRAFALTILMTECEDCSQKIDALDGDSRQAVIDAFMVKLFANKTLAAEVSTAAKNHVGGAYTHALRRFHLTPFTIDPYGSAVHELIHASTHPAFRAAFESKRNVVEGFTEYFAEEVVSDSAGSSGYKGVVDKVKKISDVLDGPFATFSVDSSEESLRLAYFKGRLDLIGWRPQNDAEQKAVAAAGGATPWDEKTAADEEKARKQRGIAAQKPHKDLLGVGLFFNKDGEGTLAVRYARVLNQSQPYARRNIYLEGQLLGTPVENPKRLGGSLGVGIELQEPWLTVTGGLRVVGTGAISGPTDARIDISPFAGVGTRLWQHVRVGAEGFVLFPISGQKDIDYGGGGTVLVEF